MDAVTYSDIATVELLDNVGDLFDDADDELLAVIEAPTPPAHRPSVCALAQRRVPVPVDVLDREGRSPLYQCAALCAQYNQAMPPCPPTHTRAHPNAHTHTHTHTHERSHTRTHTLLYSGSLFTRYWRFRRLVAQDSIRCRRANISLICLHACVWGSTGAEMAWSDRWG